MSCPWIENREVKDSEKTKKYAPLSFKFKRPRLWREQTKCHGKCVYEHVQEYKVTARRKKRKTDFEKNADRCFVTLF